MAEPGSAADGSGAGGHVLGVDSGGSGLRIAVARAGAGGTVGPAATHVSREPVRTGPAGIDADHLLDQLLPAAEELGARTGAGGFTAVCVGAAGMGTLGDALRARLPAALAAAFGVRHLALAADAVTAYAGALGQRPGAVVAAGTGLVALGTDLAPDGGWRRADGWGHLLGDCGSGAWIGRAGLEAALRAHDGRPGGSRALLARAEAVFGPVTGLPGALYPRPDRPAVLASFAPEVARCAAADPVAADILAEAARHIADTAAAACPPAPGTALALTGGLLRLGDPLLAPLRTALAERLPGVRPVEAAGSPLDGALAIAAALAEDRLALPVDGKLLQITGHMTARPPRRAG
ncbi:ATPase [Streptomyces sp. NRRL F-4489]|uniref:N-acetylglucosamine kinase n=1 Tax=Streptomyces sp. NRRL F-4489 TaxID=1609095 RepID=UPI0007487434|nr:BadF/BadG/BcrA/BcrD ATPase family protein [Streptomyces sp. NRRL F-4489]KUL55447.1 ATPase [Streptomyces sp. NRRL F-4489]